MPEVCEKELSSIEGFVERLGAVLVERANKYGSSERCLELIADMWGGVLGVPVSQKQVALCMIQLKVARIVGSGKVDYDSALDIAGYSALLARYANDKS